MSIILTDGASVRVASNVPGKFDNVLLLRGDTVPDNLADGELDRLAASGAIGDSFEAPAEAAELEASADYAGGSFVLPEPIDPEVAAAAQEAAEAAEAPAKAKSSAKPAK